MVRTTSLAALFAVVLGGCVAPQVDPEYAPLATDALTSPEGLAAYLSAASGDALQDLRAAPEYDLVVAEFVSGSRCNIVTYASSEEARDEGPARCAETYRANGVRGGVSPYGALWPPRALPFYASEAVGRWLSGCHVVGPTHAVCWAPNRYSAQQFDRALRGLASHADSVDVDVAMP